MKTVQFTMQEIWAASRHNVQKEQRKNNNRKEKIKQEE